MEVEAFPFVLHGPLGVRVNFVLPVLFAQLCLSQVEFVCLSLPAGPGGSAEGAGEEQERVP